MADNEKDINAVVLRTGHVQQTTASLEEINRIWKQAEKDNEPFIEVPSIDGDWFLMIRTSEIVIVGKIAEKSNITPGRVIGPLGGPNTGKFN